MTKKHDHFQGKDAVGHVAEAQAHGIIASTEIHGTETPGHLSAGTDSARQTAVALLLLEIVLQHLNVPFVATGQILAVFGCGWFFWKTGRSAWLGWARLERLHRVIAEEKWEIEHHRQQERDELRVLYQAKGFEGKLLEDVLDVLMADGDRLLRVMVQEELGFSLGVHEHPLKQCTGAALGVIIGLTVCLATFYLHPPVGILFGALIVTIGATAISAKYEGNKLIPAVVWNIGMLILSCGCAYYLLNFLTQG